MNVNGLPTWRVPSFFVVIVIFIKCTFSLCNFNKVSVNAGSEKIVYLFDNYSISE